MPRMNALDPCTTRGPGNSPSRWLAGGDTLRSSPRVGGRLAAVPLRRRLEQTLAGQMEWRYDMLRTRTPVALVMLPERLRQSFRLPL